MAKVFDPQGNVREIPDEQVQQALASGGKMAVRMKDPNGVPRYVPDDQVEMAKQHGGTIAALEHNDSPWYKKLWNAVTENIGSNPMDVASGMQSHVPNLGGGGQVAAYKQAEGNQTPRQVITQYAGSDPTLEESKSPVITGIKKGAAHAAMDASDLGMAAYSPAGLVMGPASQVEKGAVGVLPTAARVVKKVGGLGFGAAGATDVAEAGLENTPEAWQKRLVGGAMVAGGVHEAVPEKLPSARGVMADRMQKPVEPGGPTRAEINDAARDNNVNLDLAQATDHPVAKAVKKANRYSVASQGTYDSAAESNIDALSKWADKEASKYADNGNREVAGQRTVAALKDDLTRKQEAARTIYDGLDQRVGGVSQDVTGTIQAEAAKILAENKDYYAKHPELKPGKAWAIIEDLGSRSTKTAEAPISTGGAEVLDAAGNPITKQVTQTVPKTASWSELHQLRSDLMEFYRNSPDIVKGRSEGWVQRMVGAIDDSMTKAEGSMKPSDVADFRQANSIWKSIQETYNNPRSPYYQALKTAAPSQVPGMFASSPEFIRSLRQTISGLDGPVQRAFVEDNIINGKDGHIDLANMNSRLGRIPDAKLVEMVGAEGAKNLRIMGRVAAKVYADYKGSQTAERGVPMAEAVNLFANPVAGVSELGAQYAGAKAINSPRVVDYLTKQREAGRVPPKSGGVAGSEPVAPVTPEPQTPKTSATEYPDGTTHEAPPPETVGSKEGALTDTALFERARAKMPEGTPISAIAMEAQRMKVQEEAFVKQARKELGPKASMTSVMRRVQDLKDRKK